MEEAEIGGSTDRSTEYDSEEDQEEQRSFRATAGGDDDGGASGDCLVRGGGELVVLGLLGFLGLFVLARKLRRLSLGDFSRLGSRSRLLGQQWRTRHRWTCDNRTHHSSTIGKRSFFDIDGF